jgi:hypothetical protein
MSAEPDIDHAALTEGIERALVKLLTSTEIDGQFYDAVRQGTRDAIWAIAAQSNIEMPPGRAN